MMKTCLCTPPYLDCKCFGFLLKSSPMILHTYSHVRTQYTWLQNYCKQSLDQYLTGLLCHCCQDGMEEEVGEQPGRKELFPF